MLGRTLKPPLTLDDHELRVLGMARAEALRLAVALLVGEVSLEYESTGEIILRAEDRRTLYDRGDPVRRALKASGFEHLDTSPQGTLGVHGYWHWAEPDSDE